MLRNKAYHSMKPKYMGSKLSYTLSLAHAVFLGLWTKSTAVKSLVTKNAWAKEFLLLCSENHISWIFGLVFENVHEWKTHHWNAQDPRTQCTVVFLWIDRFANILKPYIQTNFNVQSFFFFFSSSSWNHRRASLMGHKISVGLIYHLGSTCPWISKKRKIPWLFKMTPNFLSLI